jgi:hypothetical protein
MNDLQMLPESSEPNGLTIQDTVEGRMVIRSGINKTLQKQFDNWYNGKKYIQATKSETRKGKEINWDSRKTAKCWNFFVQGAMVDDGRPMVRCLVCGDVLGHGGFFGPTPMTAHLTKGKHLKMAKELLSGSGIKIAGESPTNEEVLSYLKRTGNEGLEVWLDY